MRRAKHEMRLGRWRTGMVTISCIRLLSFLTRAGHEKGHECGWSVDHTLRKVSTWWVSSWRVHLHLHNSARWHSTLMFEMWIQLSSHNASDCSLWWAFASSGEITPPWRALISLCACIRTRLQDKTLYYWLLGMRAPEYRGCEGSGVLEIRNVKRSMIRPIGRRGGTITEFFLWNLLWRLRIGRCAVVTVGSWNPIVVLGWK